MKKLRRNTGIEPRKIKLRTFIITVVVLTGLSAGGFFYIGDYYKSQIRELNSKYKTISESYSSLSAKENTEQNELLLWQANAVICTPAGKKYHHYGCFHLQGTDYTVMGAKEAKSKGYSPCFDCCETHGDIDWYSTKKQAELMDIQQKQQYR